MSLTSWLRDYLFLPIAYALSRRIHGERLLGLKAESWSYHAAMLTTMVLCGLWHGATWPFAIWGAWLDLGRLPGTSISGTPFEENLVTHRVYMDHGNGDGRLGIFPLSDFSFVLRFFKSLIGFGGSSPNYYPALFFTPQTALTLVASLLACLPLVPYVKQHLGRRVRGALTFLLLTAVLLFSVMALAVTTYTPFIYYRF